MSEVNFQENIKLKKHIEYLEKSIDEYDTLIRDYEHKLLLNEKEIKERNQDYDSLIFRNKQLCKRVELLQNDLYSMQKNSCNVKLSTYDENDYTKSLTIELRESIAANKKLHQNIKDVEDTYIKKVSRLEMQIQNLTLQNKKPSEEENLEKSVKLADSCLQVFPTDILSKQLRIFLPLFSNLINMLSLFYECVIFHIKLAGQNLPKIINKEQMISDVSSILQKLLKSREKFYNWSLSLFNLQTNDHALQMQSSYFKILVEQFRINSKTSSEQNFEENLINLSEDVSYDNIKASAMTFYDIFITIFEEIDQTLANLSAEPKSMEIIKRIKIAFEAQKENVKVLESLKSTLILELGKLHPTVSDDLTTLLTTICTLFQKITGSLHTDTLNAEQVIKNLSKQEIDKEFEYSYVDECNNLTSKILAYLISQICYEPYLLPQQPRNANKRQNVLLKEREMLDEENWMEIALLETRGLATAYLNEMLAMSQQMTGLLGVVRSKEENCKEYEHEIKRLDEELASTRLNYEDQLSAMSEHVCLLNEQLSIFKEEMILNAARGRGTIHIEE